MKALAKLTLLDYHLYLNFDGLASENIVDKAQSSRLLVQLNFICLLLQLKVYFLFFLANSITCCDECLF
jgi:hypothetical protein